MAETRVISLETILEFIESGECPIGDVFTIELACNNRKKADLEESNQQIELIELELEGQRSHKKILEESLGLADGEKLPEGDEGVISQDPESENIAGEFDKHLNKQKPETITDAVLWAFDRNRHYRSAEYLVKRIKELYIRKITGKQVASALRGLIRRGLVRKKGERRSAVYSLA